MEFTLRPITDKEEIKRIKNHGIRRVIILDTKLNPYRYSWKNRME